MIISVKTQICNVYVCPFKIKVAKVVQFFTHPLGRENFYITYCYYKSKIICTFYGT